MSTLYQDLYDMDTVNKEELLKTMIEIRDWLTKKIKLNNWVYCLSTHKKLLTVQANIEIVKDAIAWVIKS